MTNPDLKGNKVRWIQITQRAEFTIAALKGGSRIREDDCGKTGQNLIFQPSHDAALPAHPQAVKPEELWFGELGDTTERAIGASRMQTKQR